MANAEPNRAAVRPCTCCGKPANPANRNAEGPWCDLCWTKRSHWDEGARSIALLGIGNAIKLARSWDVPRSAILSAVEHALSPEGLYEDDALSLGAVIEEDR